MIPPKAPHARALLQSTNMTLKPLTLTLRSIKEFNRRRAQGEKSDLTSCELRHLDLRGCPASISPKPGSKAPASMERGSAPLFFRPS
jgi:hypothetical protein